MRRALILAVAMALLTVTAVGDVLFDNAGHAVIGGAPLGPWEGCAGLEAALPIVFG